MIDLQIALNNIAFDEDPIVVIRKRMKDTVSFGGQNEASKEVEILCGMASPFLQKQKLFIISDREIHEIDEKVFCCVGSGAGAASGFLHLASKSLSSLRDVQTAVFTSVWLAKKTDRRCGLTDIRWLTLDSGRGELESAHIEALESYIEPSLPEAISRWIVSAPVGHQSSIPAQNLDKKI